MDEASSVYETENNFELPYSENEVWAGIVMTIISQMNIINLWQQWLKNCSR